MTANELVRVKTEGHITRVTLCRSEKGNSLSSGMVSSLADAVEHCHTNDTALLVLDAIGKNFCTGFDLEDMDRQSDDILMARFIRIELLLQALQTAPFLTVAIGHGRHIGAGAGQ